VAPPILFSLLLTSQTPDYAKTIEALEQAHAASGIPEILLSIAATYEQWPGHCSDAIQTYDRFFDACDRCAELSRAVDRFDLAIDGCVTSADEESALRERYRVPSRSPARKPGDATRAEVLDLLRRGRAIDPPAFRRLFVRLIETGTNAPVDRLNEMREEAWAILTKVDADAEQVLSMVARTKEVDPPAHRRVLDALIEAERAGDQAALNAVRAEAIGILRGSTTPPGRDGVLSGCAANPAYELGFLTVDSKPWSEVYVNGERIGTTPIAKHRIVAGCATVRAKSPVTGAEKITNVTVRPNRTSIVRLDLAPR
jgi:hypothetical protein